MHEDRDGESGDDGSGQRQVGVDDGRLLSGWHGQGGVEARPVDPQEEGTYGTAARLVLPVSTDFRTSM